jgi:hypothetical protein
MTKLISANQIISMGTYRDVVNSLFIHTLLGDQTLIVTRIRNVCELLQTAS